MQDLQHFTCSTTRTVHVPTPMLRDMEKQARRLDRTVSWCVAKAWSLSASDVRQWSADDQPGSSRFLTGRKRPESMTIPLATWQELARESARLDRSPSWVVQQAWLSARARMLETKR